MEPRQIKFRAWYSKSQTWVYFDLQKGFASDEALQIYRDLVLNGVTFYQFTGLTDKNGKEVYWGDIIGMETVNGMIPAWIVDWHNGYAAFGIKQFLQDKPSVHCGINFWKNHEVIGNIFESPNLSTQ
jgi:hypothetical protein